MLFNRKSKRDPDLSIAGLSEEQMKVRHRAALEVDDQETATDTAYLMGMRWIGESRHDEVEELCRGTLESFEDSRLLHLLARIESESGRRESALEHFERALACVAPLAPTSAISVVVEGSGLLHHFAAHLVTAEEDRESTDSSEDVERALGLWRQALDALKGLDDEPMQRRVLIQSACGQIASKCGPERTDMLWDRLGDLLWELGAADDACRMIHHRGVSHFQADNLERSVEYFRRSLALSQEAGDREGQKASSRNLAAVEKRLAERRAARN